MIYFNSNLFAKQHSSIYSSNFENIYANPLTEIPSLGDDRYRQQFTTHSFHSRDLFVNGVYHEHQY